MRKKNIEIPIYRLGFTFCIGTRQEVADLLDDQSLAGDSAEGSVFVKTQDGANVFVMWLKEFELSNNENVGTLTHEVFHLVHAFTKERGLWLEDASEETYAYLSGYIMEQCLDFLCAKKPSKKKQKKV